jgi:hypothetical protein
MLKTKLVRNIRCGDVLYFQGKLWNVRINANPALYDYIITDVEGNTLHLDKVRFNTNDPFTHSYRVCNNRNEFVTRLLPFHFIVKI